MIGRKASRPHPVTRVTESPRHHTFGRQSILTSTHTQTTRRPDMHMLCGGNGHTAAPVVWATPRRPY